MKRYLFTILLLSTIVLHPQNLRGQDAVFSQFFSVPMYLNPAFAGTSHCQRLSLNYQHVRWGLESLPGFHASFDMYTERLQGGIGFMVTSEHPGSRLSRTHVSAVYARHLQVSRNAHINFGIQAGYIRQDIRWNHLEFANPSEAPPAQNWQHALDIAAGMLLHTETFYGGFAAHHLGRPALSVDGVVKMERKFTAHAGWMMETGQRGRTRLARPLTVSPNLIVQHQGHHAHASAGFYTGIHPIMAGVWYRHWWKTPIPMETKSGMVFLVGMRFDQYQIGYSYDLSVAGTPSGNHQIHELSFRWEFNCASRNIGSRILNCPIF